MSSIKHAIISCAGIGSRLGLNQPKCLVEVEGKRIIDHLLPLVAHIRDVRLVVGFQEQLVMDYVSGQRPDIVFVRNANYASTSNSWSVSLASHDLCEPYLIIDGDAIIEPGSFQAFLAAAEAGRSLVGITPSKTDEAVYVRLDALGRVVQFQRAPRTAYEWCGVAYLAGIHIQPSASYVFDEIAKHLPLPAHEIQCFEVDTPNDLMLARQRVRQWLALA